MTIKVVAAHPTSADTNHQESSTNGEQSMPTTPPKPLARMRVQRMREKERLIELNHRLEEYLAKVRELESENNTLIELIGDLKTKMMSNTTTIKNDYDFPLVVLKNSLNAEMTNEAMARLKLRRVAYLAEVVKMKVREAESERGKQAHKIDELTRLNESLENEKETLKEKVGQSINNVFGYRAKIDELAEKLSQVNDYLDKQTLERIQYEIENRRLMEDIGFCRAVHTADKEHAESMHSTVARNTTTTPDFYKSELNRTVELVRDDFRRILDDSRVEMETFYRSNLEKMEEENKRREELQDKRGGGGGGVLVKSFRVNGNSSRDLAEDLAKLKSENSALERRYQEMNERLEEMRESNRRALDERQDLIDDLRSCLSEQMEQLRVLKASRVGSPIDGELKIYRKLLDIGHQSVDNTKRRNEESINNSSSSSSNNNNNKPAIEAPIYVYDSKVRHFLLLIFFLGLISCIGLVNLVFS